MDLFSLTSIGLYLEPDIIIIMEGYADTYHLVYKTIGGELAWGPFSQSEQKTDPEFAFGFRKPSGNWQRCPVDPGFLETPP